MRRLGRGKGVNDAVRMQKRGGLTKAELCVRFIGRVARAFTKRKNNAETGVKMTLISVVNLIQYRLATPLIGVPKPGKLNGTP